MRILFADDSMTAQNMGKKILTDAGYEVVAVSNGAAAVKKIAEQKPDIIILDIYMPGYTGLEVCDKVRASVETLKTPVLLTVGKMEPYRAEDANRVKADGVIIKPFEASDLLAVIKKLEERVVPKTVAITEQTVLLERPPEFAEFQPAPHAETHIDIRENTAPAIVDVPDNMATAAAFSDLLGPEPASSPLVPPPAPPGPAAQEFSISPEPPVEEAPSPTVAAASEPATASPSHIAVPEFVPLPAEETSPIAESAVNSGTAPDSAVNSTATPTVESPSAWDSEIAELEPEPGAPASAAPVEAAPEVKQAAASFPDTQPIEVYRESEPQEFVVVEEPLSPEETASPAPPAAAAVSQAAPSSQISHEIAADAEVDSFSAKVEAQVRQLETVVSATEARRFEPKIEPALENGFQSAAAPAKLAPAADDDFEARVAAAMSIYDEEEVEEKAEPFPTAVDEIQPVASQPAVTVEPASEPALAQASFHVEPAREESPAATPYSFEYSPPVKAAAAEVVPEVAPWDGTREAAVEIRHDELETLVSVEPEIAPADLEVIHSDSPILVQEAEVFAAVPETKLAPEIVVEPQPARVDDEKILSEIEAQLPATSVATATDSASDTQMIASAVHRVLERLKPQLIEEIARELKNSK